MHETHSIHIVTHRPAEAHATTRRWLREHNILHDSLTFSEDKTVVKTDVFIDDRPENVEALLAKGVQAVLYDRPWNQHADGLPRVNTLVQFRDFVKAVGG